MTRKQYIDQIYYTAYSDPRVSVQVRLTARDQLRRIREEGDAYEYPSYVL